jgi:hypothetical protein
MNAESGLLEIGPHDKWAAMVIAQWVMSEERRLESSLVERCSIQAFALRDFRERLEGAAKLPPSQAVINAGMN